MKEFDYKKEYKKLKKETDVLLLRYYTLKSKASELVKSEERSSRMHDNCFARKAYQIEIDETKELLK